MTTPAGATSDEELIARTRVGDMDAYDELYRRHVDDASRVARIVTNNSDEAQDVVAEAFTRVLAQLRRGRGPDAELTPYLRTVVRRLAIDRHRSSQRDGTPSDPSILDVLPRPDDPMARATDRQLVRQAFETLPERWQQVLWHTEIEGRSPASLAPALGSSPNAVAALAYRAREGLRQAYLAVNLSAEVRTECRPYAPKIAAYVRGTLSAHDTREMSAHLGQCSYCRERRDELLLLVSDLRGTLWPALLLPASGAAGAVAAGAAGGGVLAFLSPTRWGRQAKQFALAGASVAAAGVIAASAYMLLSDDEPDEPPRAVPSASAEPDDPPPDSPAAPPSAPAESPDEEPTPPAEEPEPDAPSVDVPEPDAPVDEPEPPAEEPVPDAPAPPVEAPSAPPTQPSPPVQPPAVPAEAAPSVDTQPEPSPAAAAGESITLRVGVSGNPIPALQWQYSDNYAPPARAAFVALAATPAAPPTEEPGSPVPPSGPPTTSSEWVDVEGETSDTLVISNLTPAYDGRAYRVVATNRLGSITTTPSVLSVQYAPQVAEHPEDVEVDEGDPVTFTASATANPASSSVTWQRRAPGGDWSGAPPGAGTASDGTSSTLTIDGVGAELHGYQYRAVFANALGEAPTRPATLSVRWAPEVAEHPTDQVARPGDDVTFTASVTPGNPVATSYWQTSDPDSPDDWRSVDGSDGGPQAALTVADVAADQQGTRYRAVFTNSVGAVQTDPAEFVVQWPPEVVEHPRDSTAVEGEDVTFTATSTAANPAATWFWQASDADADSGWQKVDGSDGGPGEEATLTVSEVRRDQNGTSYRAVFVTTVAGESIEVSSDPATLTVHWAPEVVEQPADQAVRPGASATFAAAAEPGNPPASSLWQISDTGLDDDWQDIPGTEGGPTTEYVVDRAGTEQDGTFYRAVFTNASGTATTEPAELVVGTLGKIQVTLPDSSAPSGLSTQCAQLVDDQPRVGDCADVSATAWLARGDGTLRWMAGEPRCLGTAGAPRSGALTALVDCDPDSSSQQWHLDTAVSYPQTIKNAGGWQLCLDVEAVQLGGRLIVYTCHFGLNQLFTFVRS